MGGNRKETAAQYHSGEAQIETVLAFLLVLERYWFRFWMKCEDIYYVFNTAGGSLVDGEVVKYGNGFMLQDLESLTQIQS